MPRARVLLFALACLAGGAPAQETPEALLALSEVQVRVDPARSRSLAEQALARLATPPDPDLAVLAHLLLCEHAAERDRALAERHASAARALVGLARRAGLRARLLACEGEVRENAGDASGALSLYEQAVISADEAKDAEYLAEALYRRGHMRGLRGEYANGLSDLKRSHSAYQQLGKQGHALTVQSAIAILYNRMGDHAQARHYFESALKDLSASGQTREQLVTLHNLGRALESLGEWGAAEHAFTQSLDLSRSLTYARGEAYALRGLASVHNARGRPTQAITLLDQAAALQRGLQDMRLRGQIQLQRGIALHQLRRATESQAALMEALSVFGSAEAPAERVRAHAELTRLFAEQNDWRNAFEQQQSWREISEQLLRRQLDERFTALKVEVDTSAREQELRLLQREQAATTYALEQERIAGRLRSATMAMAAVLVTLLAVLAWRQRRAKLAMRELALTDELTGLPNRRDVLARLEALLRRGGACALLIVDLDHFKRINDDHGHPAGDVVLREAAHSLRAGMPSDGFLGRLGGEEFVVVVPDRSIEDAVALAERLRHAIEHIDLTPTPPDGRVTASIGVAPNRVGDNASDLLRRADRALYAAKSAGRNRVEVEAAELSAAASWPDRSPR